MSSISPSDRLLARVRRFLDRRRDALGPGVVVAVSGGSDSVGLIRLLHDLAPEFGLSLTVAHLDHGARPSAAADARFVAELAAALGLPFELGRWAPGRQAHFEADARHARYAWLDATARRLGAATVALGHTRDDQAETILHRILRGTGLRGLAGMPARRRLSEAVTLVRPLLGTSRDEIRAYLATLDQPYRDDPTNLDIDRYTRSRIRHDLLPRLADDYNPRVVDALVRLGRLAGSARGGQDRWLAALVRSVTIEQNARGVMLNRDALAHLPRSLRTEVLRQIWRRQGWPEGAMSADRWERLARLLRPGTPARRRASVGCGVELAIAGGQVCLACVDATATPPAPPAEVPLEIPGIAAWEGGRVVATLDPAAPRDETIDLDALVPPLSLSGPRPGDRFAPLGLGGHSKPLNDFLRGRKVDRARRGAVPLVRDAGGIVWVVGHRIAERVRRTDATRRTLGLRWEPAGSREHGCD